MTRPLQHDDPIAPLFLPPRAPGFAVRYRTGLVGAWNTSTAANTITVDGATLTDLPVIPGPWIGLLTIGDTVGLLSTADGAGIGTYVILGPVWSPGDPRLASI